MTLTAPAAPTAPPPACQGADAARRLDLLLMALLAALALVPRTVNLLGLDPFVDEASWVDWALREYQPASPATWFAPLLRDGRPPLHFWLTLPFAAVVDNGFVAGRLAAALAGALSSVALYALGREIHSRTVGALAALLWALSPYSVAFARISSDDAALALTTILAVWSSVRLARQPSVRTGALCGLCLGLATLAKTTGVVLAAAPLLAILLLGRPRAWRSYLWPLVVTALAALVTVLPLLVWLSEVLGQLRLHAGAAGRSGERSLLALNAEIAAVWLYGYVGPGFAALAGAGLLLTLVLRQRGLLLVTALGALWVLLLLQSSTSLFSRYLLFALFPAYLLAAFAIERVAALVGTAGRGAPVAPRASPAARSSEAAPPRRSTTAALRTAILGTGLLLAVAPRAGLLVDLVLRPADAAIPESEHYRYVEQWYAVYGLGTAAQELRTRGRERPVTVLVPPASREDRVLVPYSAMRAYLRHDPSVRFVEAPALWRAQDLREVRRLARDGPTYLLVNGSYTDAPGTPNDIPAYTRRLEERLARDVPDAREVLRIPRPSAPNWLALYRLDPDPSR